MKRLLLILFFSVFSTYAQNPIWYATSASKLGTAPKMDRDVFPLKYQLFHLDFNEFRQTLYRAPMENSSLSSDLIIKFPDFEGNLKNYKVFEAPIMEKGLSDKFPTIKSYSAQGIEDPSATLRFSVTDFGLHVMSLSGKMGTFYIDTYTKDLNNYIVYSRKDIQKARSFGCLVEEEATFLDEVRANDNITMVNDGNLRQYRLVISNTIEYAAFHLNAAGTPAGAILSVKKGVVLSAMVVSMTRINGLYERDMAVRMNLVANNDLAIFIDSDNYTNSPDMINEIQPIVNALIGSANYDMGHGYCTTDSGVAQVSSVCSANKARGITGNPSPVGDPFDVDYVAHEMGHQFGASHTQNNVCNRTDTSAFEPGSASTILGYAGICAPNVQNNSDAYFHARSIFQMTSFVTTGATCRAISTTGNFAPVVNAGSNFTIPNGTAFKLTGTATDFNNDALTYCWEQYNNEVSTQPPLSTATSGPSFRSLNPSSSPVRFLPAFSEVLNGNLTPTWEVIPTVARTMNFALTVRDNRAGGGMTNRDDMTVTTANVGPFRVTSPISTVSWDSNTSQTITWNVAGTTANSINTANVNILFSSDNGVTFTTLLANTLNDGNQTVTMPNVASLNCRILVEAVGNIFYAVSPKFALGYTVIETCNSYTMNTGFAIPDNNTAFTVRTINVPISTNITDVNLAVNLTHTYVSDLQIILQGPMSPVTQASIFDRSCTVNDNINATFDDQGVPIICAATITGNVIPVSPLSTFNGLNPNGNWLVAIRDLEPNDTGSVVSYTLTICSQVATLTSNSFGLQDFILYPNPNNGNFTIQFNSDSGNEIKVNAHDLRGREIFAKSYSNSGLFNETLQLNNVQAGIYLVTVQDGARKEVKKIIIC